MQKVSEAAEAIDAGQYKYALQVCTKALKKARSPVEIAHLSVYKALAWLNLDNTRDAEVEALIDKVRKTCPMDRRLFANMEQALDMLGKQSQVAGLYEDALKKNPKDEEFARHWFQQMILRSNIDGARKAATVLNKLPNQRQYFYWVLATWNVSSVYNDDPKVRILSTAMATKLVNHALLTPTLLPERSSEALLLLSIASPDIALQFLQGDGKQWTTDIEGLRIYIDLLHNAKKYSDLRDVCQYEIDQGADDWKVVKGWVDGSIGLLESGAENSVDAKTVMTQLEERYSQRNFALGTIHLAFGLDDAEEAGVGSPLEQCLRYFRQNACKNACFGDIQTSVAFLSPEDQERFLQEIKAFAHDDKNPSQSISLQVNVLKFDYMLRNWDVSRDLTACWELYLNGIKALSASDDEIDNFPGDHALLLGCYTLIKEFNASKQPRYLLQAALCLEAGLEKSKHNFQLKLLLIRVYLLLGAVPAAFMIYAGMEIKQIQHDTLSHFLLTRISTLYTDQAVLHQIALAKSIYASNEEETPHEICRAFTEGTYHNIESFWGLWMKLRHSLTRTLLRTEVDSIALTNKETIDMTEVMGDVLYDQRDLMVMMYCEMHGMPGPEDFTGLGPFQGATAIKVWAYTITILTHLERHSFPLQDTHVEAFRSIRSSNESWNTLKRECTPAEFEYLTLLWEIYEARMDTEQGRTESFYSLSENLANRIPFCGIDQTGVSWEMIHASQLTLRICRTLHHVITSCRLAQLTEAVGHIVDAVVKSMEACIEKLDSAYAICTGKVKAGNIQSIRNSVLDSPEYMGPMKELLPVEGANEKIKNIVDSQKKVVTRALVGARAVLEKFT